MLNYTQIIAWAAAHKLEVSTDTALTTLLLRWTNDTVGEIASAYPWYWLEGEGTFSMGGDGDSTDENVGQGITYFPHFVKDIVTVWESSRGYRFPIRVVGAWTMDNSSPELTSGSYTDSLVVWGYYGLENDVITAGTISFTTTASDGTAACDVIIEGITTAGLETRETVTISSGTGTSSNSYKAGPDGVRRIWIDDDSIDGTTVTNAGVGLLTATDAGGQTIERINAAIGERAHEHIRTELIPAPTSATNHVVRYIKRIRPVVNGSDIVEIPFEFENALFLGLSRRLAEFQGDFEEAAYHSMEFRKRIQELKKRQNTTPGRLRALRPLTRAGYRRIGGGWT